MKCIVDEFIPPRDKAGDNFTSPREMAKKRHIPPVRLVSLGGPNLPRHGLMSPRDKYISPIVMVKNKCVFPKERVDRRFQIGKVFSSSRREHTRPLL